MVRVVKYARLDFAPDVVDSHSVGYGLLSEYF